MKKTDRSHWIVRKFSSHAEAEAADLLEYARMSDSDKLALVEYLRAQAYDIVPAYRDQPRLPRHAWPVVKTQR